MSVPFSRFNFHILDVQNLASHPADLFHPCRRSHESGVNRIVLDEGGEVLLGLLEVLVNPCFQAGRRSGGQEGGVRGRNVESLLVSLGGRRSIFDVPCKKPESETCDDLEGLQKEFPPGTGTGGVPRLG